MNRNAKTAKIPDFVKVVAPYASSYSSIEKVTFSPHLTDLKNVLFHGAQSFTKLIFRLIQNLE